MMFAVELLVFTARNEVMEDLLLVQSHSSTHSKFLKRVAK